MLDTVIGLNDKHTCIKLADYIKDLAINKCNIAISGGNTPLLLFKLMAENYDIKSWKNLNIYWVDERHVPFESNQSNYGNFYRIIKPLNILDDNQLNPIIYNPDLNITFENYKEKLNKIKIDGEIIFDLVILGIGEDGHTASLFPNRLDLLFSKEDILKTVQPSSNQDRITISMKVINNAKNIAFLITGNSKKAILKKVLNNDLRYPASHVIKDNCIIFVEQNNILN